MEAKKGVGSRTRSIAFVGLTVALMGASAWVAVPFGPVMLTLQMFALVFGLTLLQPKAAVAAVCAYVALGAVGLPVFSGGRGGLGVVLGPTGGYIVGYVVGAVAAAALLHYGRRALEAAAQRRTLRGAAADVGQGAGSSAAGGVAQSPECPRAVAAANASARAAAAAPSSSALYALDVAAGTVFTAVSYLGGWAWFMVVMQVSPAAAFAATVAPFALLDLMKILAACACARAVKRALRLP